MATAQGLARDVDGVPTVASATDRDTAYPTPNHGQKVYNIQTGDLEMYDIATLAWSTIIAGIGNLSFSGNGSPEGVVTAGVGSDYRQKDGSNGTVLWVKNSGMGTTGWRVMQTGLGLTVTPEDCGSVGNGATDDGPALRTAIAKIKAAGGGTLLITKPHFVAVTSEATCLLIDFSNITICFEQAGVLKWDYWGLPLIPIIGANYARIDNSRFIWSGTRGAAPGSANHFGYNGTGIVSPPDWCAHVFIGGSNHVVIDGIEWAGATTVNTLEMGITLQNGTAAGPTANTVDVTGNEIYRVRANDTYFGISALGQDKMVIDDVISDRYVADAYVGPGHVIYLTSLCTNARITNIVDKGTPIHTPGVGTYTAATSVQLKALQNSVVAGIKSSRVEGVLSLVSNTSDFIENEINDFYWSADRYPYEAALANVPVVTIAQSSTTLLMSRNRFSNWFLHDQKNAGAGRSSNCPLVGQGGNTYRATNALSNVFDNITLAFSPDGSYSKGIFQMFGQDSVFDLTIINNGGATKEYALIQGDDAARPATGNLIRIQHAGILRAPRASTTNGGGNLICLMTDSLTANAGAVDAADVVISPSVLRTLGVKRLIGNGTAHVAGDYALSAGWGNTATVSAIAARDTGGRVTITASGTGQAANPTVTLTFKDGTWTTVPSLVAVRGDAVVPTAGYWALTTASATAPAWTFVGTPTAGNVYVLDFSVIGK